MRGNVVDMAVGIVIGAAFTAVVTALVNSFINPLIKLLAGGGKVAGAITINDVKFDWGAFVSTVIYFLLVAAVIYFLVVLPINKLRERRDRRLRKEEPEAPQEIPADVQLLTEIRDLLRREPTP
ncbi:MAG: large conductance mechanosensitive channel protein MscL [Streptosporangiales bacterium]|nr:large conductance mechanosensitive channel protein MscL [Streptosporangiales bacterium]MBO0890365.1 large conductance mechanosensitive channel protein MscL [Acidothermales bacterium]